MFTSDELKGIRLFSGLRESEILRCVANAADVRLAPGEWLIREGEPPYFCILFAGRLRVVKDILGRQQELLEYEYQVGDFFGKPPFCWAPRLWSHCVRKHPAASPVSTASNSRI